MLMEELMKFLEREDPDILFCQEVYSATEPGMPPNYRTMEVFERLHFPYSSFAPAGLYVDRNGKAEQGNAIFSRFPLVARPTVYLSGEYQEIDPDDPANWPRMPRVLQHSVAKTSLGELNLLNVHGVWDLAGDDYSTARQAMARGIMRTAAPLSCVIIAGDTNATLHNPMIEEISRIYPSVFGDSPPPTSFNQRIKNSGGYPSAVVDNIFAGRGLRAVNPSLPDVHVSDHLPIVAYVVLDDMCQEDPQQRHPGSRKSGEVMA